MSFPKALYLLWPDADYVIKNVDSGINQLLIANQNDSDKADEIHPHWGNYQETIYLTKLLELYYKDKPKSELDFIALPIWNPFYLDLPSDWQFFDGEKFYPRTPCPTCIEWIEQRTNHAKFLVEQGQRIDKILFDAEHYLHSQHPEWVLNMYDNSNGPIHICKCDRCKSKGLDNKKQWDFHNVEVRQRLGYLGYGQLQNRNAWTMKKYHHKWCYLERSYPTRDVATDKTKLYYQYTLDIIKDKARCKKYGIDLKVSAGIWVERFPADKLLDYIEYIGKNPAYDGYWLYPQKRMTKYSAISNYTEEEKKRYYQLYESLIDDPNDPNSDPEFFKKLKRINKEIDDYRKSWKFKMKKLAVDTMIKTLKHF